MRRDVKHDLILVLIGSVLWSAFILSGAAAWGLFVPLILMSVLLPAVLIGLLEGPWLLRPFLGVLPSAVALAIFLVVALLSPVSNEEGDWSGLMTQVIAGGAVMVFMIALPISIVRHFRRESSVRT